MMRPRLQTSYMLANPAGEFDIARRQERKGIRNFGSDGFRRVHDLEARNCGSDAQCFAGFKGVHGFRITDTSLLIFILTGPPEICCYWLAKNAYRFNIQCSPKRRRLESHAVRPAAMSERPSLEPVLVAKNGAKPGRWGNAVCTHP
jgi:hypothetical protein